MMSKVPGEVAELLRGFPDVDMTEQAFAFLTVDTGGYPHSALLSRTELEPSADEAVLFAVVASPRTRANLRRTGTAGLIAIDGTTCHHVKLRMAGSLAERGILGCVFTVVEHKRDDLGIPLQPVRFHTSTDLAEREDWPRTLAMFASLRVRYEQP
ncbi:MULTISPECIES: hypothetical protein [unclassified Mycolicibacterium]|uniref:hypothetical protein n=1 Tax=unclassified Mycolicibacterium TaxID=2636767 RepID=UPI0012DEE721|nr:MULTISPECIES: hypothetical protein [unclassified Mycolicibacterium]MUL81201.1 hypothetical protein [Mycolicibacterium sp. CBMA 329]MUL86967.1 hypothetical protein [Mycolicibacterium sp. CBMA 331]MUL98749.1 hypothetical protein [Mycolicibacterium sp. CBMA 334]MUM25610.1 hypothetical protein [Mycolicibacterium sp. CBMA 295]MUM37264.1 hypothetical protein [Mycolicibacterium sp. CBMA 247]